MACVWYCLPLSLCHCDRWKGRTLVQWTIFQSTHTHVLEFNSFKCGSHIHSCVCFFYISHRQFKHKQNRIFHRLRTWTGNANVQWFSLSFILGATLRMFVTLGCNVTKYGAAVVVAARCRWLKLIYVNAQNVFDDFENLSSNCLLLLLLCDAKEPKISFFFFSLFCWNFTNFKSKCQMWPSIKQNCISRSLLWWYSCCFLFSFIRLFITLAIFVLVIFELLLRITYIYLLYLHFNKSRVSACAHFVHQSV